MVSFTAWHILFKEPEKDLDWDVRMVSRLMADLMRLGGRSPLPPPWLAGETEGAQS